MAWWLGAKHINHTLKSFSSSKSELFALSILLSEFSIRFFYLLMRAGVLPLKFSYYELSANLVFETRHRNALGNSQDVFQDISDIHAYNTWSSISNNFYTQSSDSQFKKTHFLESYQKWKAYIVCLKELPKTVFKRKIKQILFWNSSFIDRPVVVQEEELNLFPS